VIRFEVRGRQDSDKELWILEDKLPESLNDLEDGWRIILVSTAEWNDDYSPWPFYGSGKYEKFAGRAQASLECIAEKAKELAETCGIPAKRYIAGYSLAGLFALYALCETELFDGAASCSGSLWYPESREYFDAHPLKKESRVYLSLGDREERSRNPLWQKVGENTRHVKELFEHDTHVAECVMEMNEGGHFNDPEGRLAKGVRFLVKEQVWHY
jgi:predicted alpha/beta superfamily hydrolase